MLPPSPRGVPGGAEGRCVVGRHAGCHFRFAEVMRVDVPFLLKGLAIGLSVAACPCQPPVKPA